MRLAQRHGHRDLIVALLLGLAGCSGGDQGTVGGDTAEFRPATILEAVLVGDRAAVEQFIARSANVDETETDGTTLLMRATHGGFPDIAARLIAAGANVSAANSYGVTALYLAARGTDSATTQALLAAGADANTSLPGGETVLMTAAKTGDTEIVRALLAGGMDAAGARAQSSGYSAAALAPGPTHRADPNAKENWYGQTALMWAAAEGHADVVALLIEAGANVDAVDEKGANALILATLNGHLGIAGLLLEAGAAPNIADTYGRTVLFVATDLNTTAANPRPAPPITGDFTPVDIVKLALAKGANPDAPLGKELPNDFTLDGEHDPILNKGATAFLRAAMSGDLEIMQILLDAGADPLAATAEREAVTIGGIERLSHGKTTALMAAAGVGWRESVSRGREADAIKAIELLLDRGADINAANQSGDTALHGATLRGSTAIIQYLVDHGANVRAKNRKGQTPLDIAMGVPEDRIPYNEATAALLRSLARKA